MEELWTVAEAIVELLRESLSVSVGLESSAGQVSHALVGSSTCLHGSLYAYLKSSTQGVP